MRQEELLWVLLALSTWAVAARAWLLRGGWGWGMLCHQAWPPCLAAALLWGGASWGQAAGPLTFLAWAGFLAALILPARLGHLYWRAILGMDFMQARALTDRLGLYWWGPAKAWLRRTTDTMEAAALGLPWPPEGGWRLQGAPPWLARMEATFNHQQRAWREAWAEELAQPLPSPPLPLALACRRARAQAKLGDWAGAEASLAAARWRAEELRPGDLASLALPLAAETGQVAWVEALVGGPHAPWPAKSWWWLARAKAGEAAEVQAELVAWREAEQAQGGWTELAEATWRRLWGQVASPPTQGGRAYGPWWQERWGRWEGLARLAHPPGGGWPLWALSGGLLLAHALLHGAAAWGGPEALAWAQWAWAQGPLVPKAVWAGEGWRLLTSMAMHADGLHLGMNLAAAWVLWPHAKGWLGQAGAGLAWVVGGLGGAVAHLAWGGPGAVVGASGALMAWVGAPLGASFVAPGRPWPLRRRLWGLLLPVALLQLALDPFLPQVAAWVHAGGLATGLLWGLIWGALRGAGRAKGRAPLARPW